MRTVESPHVEDRKRLWFALAALTGLAAVLGIVLSRETPRPIVPGIKSDSTDRGGTAGEPAEAANDSERAPGAARGLGSPSSRVHGRVLDELFGVPIAARIEPDTGPGCVSDRETGRFRLGEANAGCRVLQVSAAGFEDRAVTLEGAEGPEGREIRLRSIRWATVIVEYSDGSPAVGIPVTWRAAVDAPEKTDIRWWIQAAEYKSGQPVVGATDLAGESRMALTVQALAVVEDDRTGISKTVRVLPGQEARVVLPERPLVLQLVDADSRVPITGLEVEAWFPREILAMTEPLHSDADGLVVIAATSFPVLVRLPGSRAWQHELIPLSDGASRCGFGGDVETMIRIDSAPLSGPLPVAVRACGGRVRLVDGNSGEPAEAPIRVKVRPRAACGDEKKPTWCTVYSPRWNSYHPDQIYLPSEGVLELPCYLHGGGDLARGTEPSSDLVLAAAGYRPLRIGRSSKFELGEGGIPTYVLQRAESRMLQVVHEDGRPFTRAVSIYSPEEDLFCFGAHGAPDGVQGPFDWVGGPVLVGVGAAWNWSVSAAELAAAEVVTLVVPNDTGSIVVEGIPEKASRVVLIAKLGVDLAGEYHPSGWEKGTCRFDDLPTGSYLVGPREWVLGAQMQSMSFDGMDEGGVPRPMRTPVRRSQTSRVKWVDSWMAGRAIEGRVQVRGGGRVEPFLVPLHGPAGELADDEPGRVPRMIFGRRSPRIPLDREGRYRIAPTDPLPKRIAICAADETTWGAVTGLHVLEVIAPGESVEIPAASVELHWKGEPADLLLEVGYVVPVESLRHPLFTFYTKSRNRWVPGTVLRLEGVPVHVRELYVTGRPLPLELREGETKRIEVDLDELPPPRNW